MDDIFTQKPNHTLDATGLICPEPIMLLHKTMRGAQSTQSILMLATDPAARRDVANFCNHLGHTLVAEDEKNGVWYFWMIKR